MKKSIVLLVLSLFILAGCGGSGSGDSGGGDVDTPITTPDYGLEEQVGDITGVLLDEKVTGVEYSSSSYSGTTDASGNFTCAAGEEVTFSVNSLVVGKSPCLAVITPIELVTEGKYKWDEVSFSGEDVSELSSSENKKLKRLLMLMQTVDTNGDPSDGISVDSNTATALNSLSVTQESLNSLLNNDSDTDFSNSLAALVSAMGGSTVVANSSSAVSHFQTTLSSQTSCTVSDITGSGSVSGVTPNCVALTCSTGYSLSDGTCLAKTSCTTSDVSNSSAVSGYVEDGCSATACNSGYGLNSATCVAMTACTTGDVANSTAVTGYVDNSTCTATSCDSGYVVSSGSCVVSTASQVVSDAVDYYNTNHATVDFITDRMAQSYCSGASSFSTMESLYADRDTNNFLSSGAYSAEITCLDNLVNGVVTFSKSASPVGIDREDDVLEVTGAPNTTSSYFNVDDSLSTEELVILELLFADQ